MSLVIDLPQPVEARLDEEATRVGVTPAELVVDVIKNTFDAAIDTQKQKQLNASSVALLQQWLDECENGSPEDVQDSEANLKEFKRNLNTPRKEAGGRLLFPEIEMDR